MEMDWPTPKGSKLYGKATGIPRPTEIKAGPNKFGGVPTEAKEVGAKKHLANQEVSFR